MKIAVIYTATTPELIAGVNAALAAELDGLPADIASYQDPSILQEARDHGGLTPACARRLVDLYEQGVREGADILLNCCSSVGEVARRAKPLYELCGTVFLRIDEDMARAAVAAGTRIGVVATLPTTLNPTKELIQQCADEAGKPVELVDALADGAFGLDADGFKQKLIDTGRAVRDRVDVLLFAQGSMSYAEADVAAALGLPVFSSIRFGARATADAARRLTN